VYDVVVTVPGGAPGAQTHPAGVAPMAPVADA
jgi:hypothetical protein